MCVCELCGRCRTFRQGQQRDGSTQPSTAKADQVWALCLELEAFSGLDQVQRSALKTKWVRVCEIHICFLYYQKQAQNHLSIHRGNEPF